MGQVELQLLVGTPEGTAEGVDQVKLWLHWLQLRLGCILERFLAAAVTPTSLARSGEVLLGLVGGRETATDLLAGRLGD